MDEHDILQHLLEVEKSAAGLVADAQNTAGERLSEQEKRNREEHDVRFHDRQTALEAERQASMAILRKECEQQITAYRSELDSRPLNRAGFQAAVRKLLLEIS